MRAEILEVTAWLNRKGYMLNNCFQRDDGQWQVNVRLKAWTSHVSETTHFYAKSHSLAEALAELVTRLGGTITETPVTEVQSPLAGAVDDYATALARAHAILDRAAPCPVGDL